MIVPAKARLEDPGRDPATQVARGKATRRAVPREAHAQFDPAPDRPDPVRLLEDQARTRLAELVPIRYGRMLASPLAYLRGAALAMAGDLAGTPDTGFIVQACGDAHLGNFGIFASPERRLVFDINDFDETLPAPWEWDVKRLATSLEIAGRVSGYGPKQRRRLVRETAAQYRLEMRRLAGLGSLDVWYSRGEVDELQARFRVVLTRRERTLAGTDLAAAGQEVHNLPAIVTAGVQDMSAGGRPPRSAQGVPAGSPRGRPAGPAQPRIKAAPPLIVPLTDLEPGGQDELGAQLDRIVTGYRASLEPDRRYLMSHFAVADVARKVSGIGSVGLPCWLVLLTGRDRGDYLFLQLKEAQPSVLSQFAGATPFPSQGQRVVSGQRLMQAASDMFLGWHRSANRDYYVRQLRDWKFSIATAQMAPDTMRSYGALCGRTLARAHARSGDRLAIGAYLGSSAVFETAIAEFAATYADQNERDFARFRAAVKSGRLTAQTGV
jgi:uncharacterized protein (DUF2252 family)